MEQPSVPPPPARNRFSVEYGPGVTGLHGALTFLESFGTGCRDVTCRCFAGCLSPHQLSEIGTEVPAPAGLGLACNQVIYAGKEDPPAHATASHTPSSLRVLPGTADDGKVAPCHTGCHPGHAPAAPRKAPDQVVHQNLALRAARAAAKHSAVTAVRVWFEDGPEVEDRARIHAGAHGVSGFSLRSRKTVKAHFMRLPTKAVHRKVAPTAEKPYFLCSRSPRKRGVRLVIRYLCSCCV